MASPSSVSLPDLWAATARQRGNTAMIRDAFGSLSWRECLQELDLLADALRDVAPGTLVMLAMPADRRFALCTLALWRRGATVMPVPGDATSNEISQVEQLCRPQWLVSGDECVNFAGHVLHRVAENPPIFAGRCTTGRQETLPVSHARFCQLTSGSTGAPKPVLISEDGILAGVRAQRDYWAEYQGHSLVLPVPLYHAMGGALLFEALLNGIAVTLLPDTMPSSFVQAMGGNSRYVMAGTPYLIRLLAQLNVLDACREHLAGLVLGSAPVTDDLVQNLALRLPDATLTVRYGLTECFGAILQAKLTAATPVTVAALAHCTVDPASRTATQSAPALLRVRTGAMGIGYLTGPDSVSRFEVDEEHYFGTGDLFYAVGDSHRFIGRTQIFIKRQGFRINPLEVEDALIASNYVHGAAVVGLPDEASGERVVALVECDAAVSTTQIIEHLKGRISGYKIPQTLHRVPSIPRTRVGKVDRVAARELALTLAHSEI